MSRGFYNYDTRGASAASQIINLERMVEERDQTIERLRELLEEAGKDAWLNHNGDLVDRIEAALRREQQTS